MIENVYPIRKSEVPVAGNSRKLPRNIRTCGRGGGMFPVYMEDYVETYIHRLAETGFPECSAVVLVGQVMETEKGRCLFIRGGINANKICDGDRPVFGEDVWNEVYEKIRLYFPEDEVVGWCVAGPGFRLLQENLFLRAHIDNFADSEKVFLCYESLEKELVIRICKDGGFYTLPGYYIYYEKNDEMQSYMLESSALAKRPGKESVGFIQEVAEEPEEREEKTADKQARSNSAKKDILQLAAIACLIVLIVSVMVGTDTLSVIKESVLSAGIGGTIEENPVQDGPELPEKDPEELAFGDFSFLDDKPEQLTKTPDEPQEVESQEPEQAEAPAEQEEPAETKTPEEQQVAEAENEQENPDRIVEENVTVLSPTEYTAYIVKSGDTLAGICKAFYGSVEFLHYICELNQLKDIDSIYAGQELILPKK